MSTLHIYSCCQNKQYECRNQNNNSNPQIKLCLYMADFFPYPCEKICRITNQNHVPKRSCTNKLLIKNNYYNQQNNIGKEWQRSLTN